MLNSEIAEDKMQQKDDPKKIDLLKSVKAMEQDMESVEYKLIDKVEANSDDKYYVSAYKIYLNLIWLNGEIGTGAGDVAGGADFAPTDTDMSLLAMIEKDLAAATEDYQETDGPAVPCVQSLARTAGSDSSDLRDAASREQRRCGDGAIRVCISLKDYGRK